MVLKVYDFVQSDTAVSYDDGKKCYKEIIKVIDIDDVVIDFENVKFVITAFLNPLIGDLILQKGREVMKKISIKNANDSIIDKIKIVKDGALLKREDMA